VYSPSHEISLERIDKHTVKAAYTSTASRPNTDFELFYKLSDSEISFHLFAYKEDDEDGYFLMLITPEYIDRTQQPDYIAKDMVFTIDRSGSMGGAKIAQAREGLKFCVNRLMPEDRFNIVTFNSAVTSSSSGLLSATSANVQSALSFIAAITATGSTNIGEALTTSLGYMNASSSPRYIIFLTDGLPTAGVTDRQGIATMVRQANTNETRIFSVGFGYDVNSILLDQLSTENGGFAVYCAPDDNIEEVISNLFAKIESPVLTSPAIAVSGIEIYGLFPQSLPDLFAGSEIAVYGRYKGGANATVTLTGEADGAQKTLTYQAKFSNENTQYSFVPRLWATQKIAQLMTDVKNSTLTLAQEQAIIDTIQTLSITYGIVTPYTSAFFTQPYSGAQQTVYEGLKDSIGQSGNDMSNYKTDMQQGTNAEQTQAADAYDTSWYVAPKTNQTQTVDDKIFVFSPDNIWVDATLDSTAAYDTIYYGSDEYFALAATDPQMLQYMTVGNQAAINYGGTNLVILDAGGSGVIMPRGEPDGIAGRAGTGSGFKVACTSAQVRFLLPSGNGAGSIAVYSARGAFITAIPVTPSAGSISWKGTDRHSRAVSDGMYCAVYRSAGKTWRKRFAIFR
jgi:Ca-activated chloride channel family protein